MIEGHIDYTVENIYTSVCSWGNSQSSRDRVAQEAPTTIMHGCGFQGVKRCDMKYLLPWQEVWRSTAFLELSSDEGRTKLFGVLLFCEIGWEKDELSALPLQRLMIQTTLQLLSVAMKKPGK